MRGDENFRCGYAHQATGGDGGALVVAQNSAELKNYLSTSGRLKIKLRPRTEYIVGSINVASNKTLIGDIGSTIKNSELSCRNAQNIVIYHVRFREAWGDGIKVRGSDLVHISWCTFDGGDEPSTKHGGKLDGAVDVVDASAVGCRVTICFCRFLRWHKVHLIGWSDAPYDHLIRVSLYRNWYKANRRLPQVNRAYVHARDCVMDWRDACAASYAKARVYMDRCYFTSLKKRRYAGEYKSSGKMNGYLGFGGGCKYKDCEPRQYKASIAKADAKALWETMPKRSSSWNSAAKCRKEAGMQYR